MIFNINKRERRHHHHFRQQLTTILNVQYRKWNNVKIWILMWALISFRLLLLRNKIPFQPRNKMRKKITLFGHFLNDWSFTDTWTGLNVYLSIYIYIFEIIRAFQKIMKIISNPKSEYIIRSTMFPLSVTFRIFKAHDQASMNF